MLAVLAADRLRVAELQTRILDLKRALSDLRLEQVKAQLRLHAYRYPVTTLPNELVSEIFVRVLPPYPDFPQLDDRFSPIWLTQICRSWRKIALDTPALWSTISSFDDMDKRDENIFKLWLQRSRQCPLSIGLGCSDAWRYPGDCIDLVEAIAPYRARWGYLKIHIRPADITGLIDFTRYDMPLLRTLVLNNYAALHSTFPWTQLTSLTFPAAHPSECLPILVQTRNLVHCELRVTVYYHGPHGVPEPPQDIQLLCLESLTFIHVGGDPSYLAPIPVDALTAFISKSGCKLEELDLTGAMSVPQESYHQAFPSLMKLSFDEEIAPYDGEDSADSDS
ncbi:hypothetical protein DFH06DRAFT_1338244 [Mycena polygramma]|nr:hypothetical protein DFH06DRAFT_1338244 [Mycena polygramma]